ncbi:MAG: transcriptional repressor LexA [Clostridium sp.]|uniref:transcriptional repressor LexA n=1 Tax=Clostridium sp. TaxID=1506 RepID=UPI002FC9B03D
MSNVGLSEKEQIVLDYIRDSIQDRGYPPSVREICAACGFKSTSSAHGVIHSLEKKGVVRKDPVKTRALEIVEDARLRKEMVHVPIVGEVAAGEPILAVENIVDTFPLPMEYIKSNKQTFMLQVKGSSMIEAGINDGDLLIVESTSTANNGEIVVALIEDSATVKRFYKEKDHIVLKPENSAMDNIIVKDCAILGKAIGLFRTMN